MIAAHDQARPIDLGAFPRRKYLSGPTPFEEWKRLGDFLGIHLFAKRDDQLGLAGGGNKNRKLEYLVAQAITAGADTLITTGAVQSNHCRLTLAAANREGMRCRLLLEERVARSYRPHANGNNLLFEVLGAEEVRVVHAGANLMDEMNQMADAVAAEGRRAFVIPGGGSVPVGALGYVACANELLRDWSTIGLQAPIVVCASGSGGTHAGLVVGLAGHSARVIGISVRRNRDAQRSLVEQLARDTVDLLGLPGGLQSDAVDVRDGWVGPGYSLPTPEMVDAVQLVARLEGVLLDPVYTGKAMAGLIGLVQSRVIPLGATVVFVHTGGSAGLFGYPQYFFGPDHANSYRVEKENRDG